MLPTDHQLTKKKLARVPPGGALPLEKNLAKEGKCFRQTTNGLNKNGESFPWGGPPPGKKYWQRRAHASGRPPIEFKKMARVPPGGARPLEK